MKEKILPFIIGLLVGAILATGGFLIYSKVTPKANVNNINNGHMMRKKGERTGIPGKNNDSADLQNEEKPALPPDANGQMPNGETPEVEKTQTKK